MSVNRVPFEEAKKRLTVSSIPKSLQQQLAFYLDKFCESNWEYLAEELGITPQEIEWVKNTVIHCPSGSPTFRLFDLFLRPREVSLEKFLEALETIKNFASVKAITEGYANGAFDSTLKQLTSNGYKTHAISLRDQCPPSALDTCRSYRQQYHSSPSFQRSGNCRECPGHGWHGFGHENYRKIPSPDGSFRSSEGSLTYDSMEGNVGDSISYTKFDSDYSSVTELVYERQVPFIEALFRAENQLPSINDVPGGPGEVLDRSKGGPVEAESGVIVEPGRCNNGFCCEEKPKVNGIDGDRQRSFGRCSCADCQCADCRRKKFGDKNKCCNQLEACTGQHPAPFSQKDPAFQPLPKHEIVKYGLQDPGNGEPKPEMNNDKDTKKNPDGKSSIVQSPLKKDLKKIRIFVTYADDSKKHMKCVMQLCDCLKKNNFNVSLDVRETMLLSQDRIGWYDKRFKVADFVLVLISPKYFLDVTEPEKSKKTLNDELALNTLYIHRCMQAEYMENNCMNKRFIPVLMPGATKSHVPVWLQNTTKYVWPEQYKNLFFYMMYPTHLTSEHVVRDHGARMPTVQQTNH